MTLEEEIADLKRIIAAERLAIAGADVRLNAALAGSGAAKPLPDDPFELEGLPKAVRVSEDVTKTIAVARSGRIELLDAGRTGDPEKSGRDYSELSLCDGGRITMALPFRYDGGTVGQDVRKTIPPHLLRYFVFAMHMALRDDGRDLGIFRLCEDDVADILGEPLRLIGGRRRVSSRAIEGVEQAFRDLSEIWVDRIGSVSAGNPERLMQSYQADFGPRHWAPARLALLACKGPGAGRRNSRGKRDDDGPGRFVQVPFPVLRLNSADAAIGIGLATLWRDIITRTVTGPGYHRTTLGEILPLVGWNVEDARRIGLPKMLARAAERLPVIARDGDLGTVEIAAPEPGADVVLTPSATVEAVYRPMIETHQQKKRRSEQAEAEADAGVKTSRRKKRRAAAS